MEDGSETCAPSDPKYVGLVLYVDQLRHVIALSSIREQVGIVNAPLSPHLAGGLQEAEIHQDAA